jgi:hypothetical protein
MGEKNVQMESSQTSKTIQHSKQKIEEIMSREPDNRRLKSTGRKQFERDAAESRLDRIDVSSPQASAGGGDTDSTPTMANH